MPWAWSPWPVRHGTVKWRVRVVGTVKWWVRVIGSESTATPRQMKTTVTSDDSEGQMVAPELSGDGKRRRWDKAVGQRKGGAGGEGVGDGKGSQPLKLT
ncbi:hypothetical protein E2562_002911 [Oryza meyeriana var. granulata]|uniref:Uncharacterized protein n=1 Tax=Oryza meyeriana var. granulata TaxID=110450 RepID=A0A6G1DDD3_9ORYZ|nr:hypothetical protein E2562_002911 [Oryza meyeriana var. granulata]